MLNNSVGNVVYRFLRDISEFNKINGLSFRYLMNFNYDYIPRVRCGKLVIIPRSFKIKIKDFSKDNFENMKTLKRVVVEYKKIFNMPSILYVTEHDNRMLINLNNEYHLNELYLILKSSQNKEILLQEFEGNIEKNWAEYNFEFVVPLIRNKKYFNTKNKKETLNDLINTKSTINNFSTDTVKEREKRLRFPGSNWIYIKLYNNEKRTNELLGNEIYQFINNLKSEEIIKKYFFIRYKDDGEYIRLRLEIKNMDYLGEAFRKLNEWFNYLYDIKLIKNVIIDSYDKEIERYGGVSAIKAAEEFFEMDSNNILKYINLIENKDIEFTEFNFAVCNIISIMDNIGLDYNNQLEIFNYIIPRNKLREKFLADRDNLIKISNSDNDWKGLKDIEDGELIYPLISDLGKAANKYFKVIDDIDDKGMLKNYKMEIMLSLFHMHCNRLFGADRDKEEIAHSLVRHSLYALKYHKSMGIRNE